MNAFTGKCDVPLGVESGRISDHQLTAFSNYENDYRFGAHRARLRLNSWPPGYRADKTILGDTEQFPWIRIDLGGEQIVTGIATQGYGNASVSEWITRYKLMYATKNEILEFVDNDGEEMVSFFCQNIERLSCYKSLDVISDNKTVASLFYRNF